MKNWFVDHEDFVRAKVHCSFGITELLLFGVLAEAGGAFGAEAALGFGVEALGAGAAELGAGAAFGAEAASVGAGFGAEAGLGLGAGAGFDIFGAAAPGLVEGTGFATAADPFLAAAGANTAAGGFAELSPAAFMTQQFGDVAGFLGDPSQFGMMTSGANATSPQGMLLERAFADPLAGTGIAPSSPGASSFAPAPGITLGGGVGPDLTSAAASVGGSPIPPDLAALPNPTSPLSITADPTVGGNVVNPGTLAGGQTPSTQIAADFDALTAAPGTGSPANSVATDFASLTSPGGDTNIGSLAGGGETSIQPNVVQTSSISPTGGTTAPTVNAGTASPTGGLDPTAKLGYATPMPGGTPPSPTGLPSDFVAPDPTNLDRLAATGPSGAGGTPPTSLTAPAGGSAPSGGVLDSLVAGAKANPLQTAGIAASGGLLAASLFGDNTGPYDAKLQKQANSLNAQGQQLMSYLTSGTLPPGIKAGVDQATKAARAKAISNAAQQGQPTDPTKNTALAQQLQAIEQQAYISTAQIGQLLLQSGLSETQMATGIYETLAKIDQQQAAQLTQAIAGFAAALGGSRNLTLKVA